jgi:hypothetical protein
MLLALASAVFLGSESLGTRDHILLSQIWDFPFRRLLRLAGSRWRYSTPPPHGSSPNSSSVVASHNCRTDHVENITSQRVYMLQYQHGYTNFLVWGTVNTFVTFQNLKVQLPESRHWKRVEKTRIDLFLFVCGLTTLSISSYYAMLNYSMINYWWVGNTSSRSQITILAFIWWGWGKPRKTSVMIANVHAGIRGKHLFNKSNHQSKSFL